LRLEERDSSSLDALPDAPLVLVARAGNSLRLAAIDARAQALGLAPGQTLADARACHPELLAVAMDEAADRQLLARLARLCGDYSPAIETAPPDGLVIDVTGVAHLFEGEAALAVAVARQMTDAGLTVRHALAGTAEAARALARHARLPVEDELAAIRALPVAALGLEEEATLGLRRAGLKTVGDVATRPSATVAARFGLGAVESLRRLLGEAHAPIVPLEHRAPLRFERRFAEPIGQQAAVAAA